MTFTEIPEHDDTIPGRPIAWTLVGTVLVIACCVVVVWALAAFRLAPAAEPDVAPQGPPFSTRLPVEADRAAASAELDRWSWADRAARRVRLPVTLAIDRYLERRETR